MYARVLSLLLTVAFALGCESPVEVGEDDMARPYATAEQWGQERTFAPASWQRARLNAPETQPQVVLQRDAPDALYQADFGHLPRVNTLLCGVQNADSTIAQNYSLRWELTLGVGGARTPIRFDAVGVTRLAIPTEGFTLSLLTEDFPPPFPAGDTPAGIVSAFAFIGEGGVGHSYADGAIFTQPRRLVTTIGADAFDVAIPQGASAVRVVGKDATSGGISTPFRTNLSLNMLQGGSLLATMVGQGAAVADPSLRTLYYSGLWFPLPGSMTKMTIGIGDFPTTTNLALQFKLDM